MLEGAKEPRFIGCGKIDLPKGTMSEKFEVIKTTLPKIIEAYNPNIVIVEQTIYISNPKTSRILAYIVGYTWGKAHESVMNVSDVAPMTWKSGVGYKRVTKKEMDSWGLDTKETKRKAEFERKDRIVKIIYTKISGLPELTDTDITDAIGIALWGLDNL